MNKLFLVFALTVLTPVALQAASADNGKTRTTLAEQAGLNPEIFTLLVSQDNGHTYFTEYGTRIGTLAALMPHLNMKGSGVVYVRPGSSDQFLRVTHEALAAYMKSAAHQLQLAATEEHN